MVWTQEIKLQNYEFQMFSSYDIATNCQNAVTTKWNRILRSLNLCSFICPTKTPKKTAL
jgi:hypothetical protein